MRATIVTPEVVRPSVFLSHSSADVAFSRRLARDLRAEGISVWFDEVELRPGDNVAAIETAIRETRFLVIVVSNAALRSDWVKKEFDLASALEGVRILPIVIEEVSERWGGRLAEHAIADARTGHRRALWRLISSITGRKNPFITAKEAVDLVKNRTAATGELFGVSQQGVAQVCSLANESSWRLCDASEGVSRVWIVEMYASDTHSIHRFLVRDESIDKFPVLVLLDADPEPAAESVVVLGCAINPEAPKNAPAIVSDSLRPVTKRYTRYRPVPITRNFVDSDVAVSSAASSDMGKRLLTRHDDVFPMMKLEADPLHGNAVLWKVSFFDSSLTESVLTVGVDAMTGAVKYPAMENETFNANFTHAAYEDGEVVLSHSNQLTAIARRAENRRPTFRDALRAVSNALGPEADRWQLAFISTTGAVEPLVSRHVPADERLLRVDGTAGQWVVELCSVAWTQVTEDSRTGYEYALRRMIVTAAGVEAAGNTADSQVFTVPLHHCPVPRALAQSFDAAMALALRTVTLDFKALSVVHTRRSSGLAWYFRFYDHDDVVAKVWVTGDGSRVTE